MPNLPSYFKACVVCGDQFHPASNRQKYCEGCGAGAPRKCFQCGRGFRQKSNTTGKYCSRACRGAAVSVHRDPRECVACGKTYEPTHDDQRSCSRECANIAMRKRYKTCPVCGEDFVGKTSAQITCSRVCAGSLRRMPGEMNCERCGKHMKFDTYRRTRFCSRECRAEPLGTSRKIRDYMLIKVGKGYPGAHTNGWMLEHRYVLAEQIGRPLEAHETVHHKNGDPTDNRPENLELRSGRHGRGASAPHCPTCCCFDH